VVKLLLTNSDGVGSGQHIWVGTEGWDWVVDCVASLLWMKVLSAAGRVADWIILGLKLNISNIAVGLVVDWLWNNPVSILVLLWIPRSVDAFLSFHGFERVKGINVIVVLIVVLWRWRRLTQIVDHEFVLELFLRNFKRVVSTGNVVVGTKVWNWIIHWVSLLLWMLVLSASCR